MSSTDNTTPPRDLRDRALFRVGVLVALLAVALLSARACGSGTEEVNSRRAIQLARAQVSFVPDRQQVRRLQRGIPARPYWGVSFVELGPDGQPAKVEVYLVDARTGEVTRQ